MTFPLLFFPCVNLGLPFQVPAAGKTCRLCASVSAGRPCPFDIKRPEPRSQMKAWLSHIAWLIPISFTSCGLKFRCRLKRCPPWSPPPPLYTVRSDLNFTLYISALTIWIWQHVWRMKTCPIIPPEYLSFSTIYFSFRKVFSQLNPAQFTLTISSITPAFVCSLSYDLINL